MPSLILFWALLKKELVFFKRYLFDTISMLVVLYVVFLLMFLGYRGFAAGAETYGTTLGNMITGYLLWMLAMNAYSQIAQSLYTEAREGILEQHYMSPFGYTQLAVLRLIGSLALAPLLYTLMVLAMVFTTGQKLNFDVLSLLPLYIIFTSTITGLGFALGGLQLIFKKINSLLLIVQFLLVGVVAAPLQLGWTRFLPGTLASELIRQVTVQEIRITGLAKGDLFLALAVGLVYLFLGWGLFKICERKAMQAGKLAHF